MKNELNGIERDLISFVAQKRGKTEEEVRPVYLNLKMSFDFKSTSFRDLTERIQVLHDLYFGMENEDELFATYQFHAYLAILRFVSYSQPARLKHLWQNFFYFFKIVFRGDPARAWCSFKRQAVKALRRGKKTDLVQYVRNNFQAPVVVDYGCGLAYNSFRMGKEIPDCKIVLVDIDSIMNEFVCFRFRKHKIPFEALKITGNNHYPQLPHHQVCLADEVMEHLKDPLRVFNNIRLSMAPGGILIGDYGDHCPELFHLHTDMAFFREELNRYYVPLGGTIYRKK